MRKNRMHSLMREAWGNGSGQGRSSTGYGTSEPFDVPPDLADYGVGPSLRQLVLRIRDQELTGSVAKNK